MAQRHTVYPTAMHSRENTYKAKGTKRLASSTQTSRVNLAFFKALEFTYRCTELAEIFLLHVPNATTASDRQTSHHVVCENHLSFGRGSFKNANPKHPDSPRGFAHELLETLA